ncbi:hypothetical protein DV515_00015550, partial [Chloebia gouldiae]
MNIPLRLQETQLFQLHQPSFDTILSCRVSEVMWPSPLGSLPGTGLRGTSSITSQWVLLQYFCPPQCFCPPQHPGTGMPEAQDTCCCFMPIPNS